MDETVNVEITNAEGVAVVTFQSGCISDVEGISTAGGKIRSFVEKSRPSRLLFDFCEVKFFSSQVLGLLLDIRARLQGSGGEVALSGINPRLHRVFKITNLDKVFRFFEDKDAAVKALSGE